MPELILVKHSLPQIVPGVPAHQWRLSDEGRQRCDLLASRLSAHLPDMLVSSLEAKALETAHLAAKKLGVPVEPWPDLHEHSRNSIPFMDRTQFEEAAALFFQQPHNLVFGEETASQAEARFNTSLGCALTAHPGQTLAVFSHGTVISLFVARACGLDPYLLWQRLALPSYIVLSLPDLHLLKIVDDLVLPCTP